MLRLPSGTLKNLCLCLDTVFLVELVDTASRLGSLLLAGVERMALGTDFHMDALLSGTRNKSVAAVAGNGSLIIIRMYTLFHDLTSFSDINTRNPGSGPGR